MTRIYYDAFLARPTRNEEAWKVQVRRFIWGRADRWRAL